MLNFSSRAVVLVIIWLSSNCISKTYSNCNGQKCKTTRIHGLKTSDCFKMDWKEFPKCLASDVEVIDLSYNRLRKISRSDFQKHPYIKYMYLADNLIVNIDDDTLIDLDKLETLDLSLNALGKVPHTIFQLPSLKTLYLSQNINLNISESIEEARPISSPITKLDISLITSDNDPKDFPDFGEMPFLANLNISGNQFNYLLPKHFAGLCNLQVLDNVNVTCNFKSSCDCRSLNNWLEERNVKFIKFMCFGNQKDCSNYEINQDDLDTFQKCQKQVDHINQSKMFFKVGIGIGTVLGIALLIVAIVFWKYRQNKKKNTTSLRTPVSYESGKQLLHS